MGLAMKPAPFRTADNIDNKQENYHSKSTHKGSDGYSKEGLTEIFDKAGKELWSAPFFIGRRGYFLSDDGKNMVLKGSYNFFSRISARNESTLVEVFNL